MNLIFKKNNINSLFLILKIRFNNKIVIKMKAKVKY